MSVYKQVVLSFILSQPLELEGWSVKPDCNYCSISFSEGQGEAADKEADMWIRSEFLELANEVQKKFNPNLKWRRLGKFEFGLYSELNNKPARIAHCYCVSTLLKEAEKENM